MTLAQLRSQEIGNNIQVIIFTLDGTVLESDDILVKLAADFNVFNDTMFSGMEDVFEALSATDSLEFDCIETDINGKNSHYDFTIKRIPNRNSVSAFGMIIFDYGKQYQKVFELQQERNLAEMQYAKVEREANKLKEEKEAVDRLFEELQNDSSSQYILMKTDNLLVNLNLNEILYLEGYGDYVKVHTSSKMYITYNTLKVIESNLPKKQFFRIHRSYIVRLDKIKNIEQLSAVIGTKVLPVGKAHKAELIRRIGQL